MRISSWCRKARLGPGYDSEATVLNRCVMHSAGLTREADPRHAEQAVTELGLQAAREPSRQAERTTGPRRTGA